MSSNFTQKIREKIIKQINVSNLSKQDKRLMKVAGINPENLQRFILLNHSCNTDTLEKYCKYFEIEVFV